MKAVDRDAVTKLEDIPNVGGAMAGALRLIGIDRPGKLAGQDAVRLYEKLGKRMRKRPDPCVLDVLMAAVHFMDTGETREWWSFTAERKRRLAGEI